MQNSRAVLCGLTLKKTVIIFKCFHSTHVFIGERVEKHSSTKCICNHRTLRYVNPKFLILEKSFLLFMFACLFLACFFHQLHHQDTKLVWGEKKKERKKVPSFGLNVERGSDTTGHSADEVHVWGSRGQPWETQLLRRVGDPEAGGASAARAFFCFPCSAVQDPGWGHQRRG